MANNNKLWIIGGVIVGSALAVILILKKKAQDNTIQENLNQPSATNNNPPATSSNTSSSTPAPTNQTTLIGKSAYVGKPGLIMRSSPKLNDGWWGMFGNDLGQLDNVGTYMGVVKLVESDLNSDKNPATGKVYNWYWLDKDPKLVMPSSDKYYVREDYTNLK